jgi:hypothetical protein
LEERRPGRLTIALDGARGYPRTEYGPRRPAADLRLSPAGWTVADSIEQTPEQQPNAQ